MNTQSPELFNLPGTPPEPQSSKDDQERLRIMRPYSTSANVRQVIYALLARKGAGIPILLSDIATEININTNLVRAAARTLCLKGLATRSDQKIELVKRKSGEKYKVLRIAIAGVDAWKGKIKHSW